MLFFEKKEVRIAKKLLKFEQKGGKLLGAECYYLATFFYDNSNIPAVLHYLQKGVEINSLECRISYWRVFLKEHYKEIGWKRQDLANYIHSLAQECDHPEVCWDDTLELARKKAQLHDAFAMNIKAANLGSYHAIRELFAYCEVRPEYEAQALYWLYKALQHFPKDGSVKDSEVMELHLKFANRFPGDDVQYITQDHHGPVMFRLISKPAKHIAHGVPNQLAQSGHETNSSGRRPQQRHIRSANAGRSFMRHI